MSCNLSESCKVIIDSKDKEIEKLVDEKAELECVIEEHETKENVMKIFRR